MRSLILIFVFLALLGCTAEKEDACDVLPKDINYKIVLNGSLYVFTEHGLIKKGFFIDFEKWHGNREWFVLDNAQKAIYFEVGSPGHNVPHGIYKIDLTKPPTQPIFIAETKDGYVPTISPDGNLLTFYLSNHDKDRYDYTVMLLNLKTKELQKIAENGRYGVRPVWINNRQFIYKSYGGAIFLFDVFSMEKTKLALNGYALGAITPDEKHVLLSGNGKTVLYNPSTKAIDEILINEAIDVSSMFWLPDGRGFIYPKYTWEDYKRMHPETGGIFYYSLDKKKSVRLIGTMDLRGGFVVPLDVELNPVDNEHNRRMLSFAATDPDGVRQVCVK